VTVERLRILAGQEWGQLLLNEVEQSALEAREWTQQHIEIIKSTPTSMVGLLELQGQPCYLKFYQGKSWLQRLLFRLGLGRGSRSYRMAGELSRHGILVPQPLACLLTRRGMILLTAAIPDAVDIQTLWEQGLAGPDNPCWHDAGVTLAGLHSTGFCHGDYKWSNLLGADGKLYLVDLEAVSAVGLSRNRCFRDIARFTLNAEDMGAPPSSYEQFLQAYLDGVGAKRKAVVQRTLPVLEGLRAHHLSKYGARGHALMGVERAP
jgi:tRNA A-37 threonylcarbamoyl transferase component Bud32